MSAILIANIAEGSAVVARRNQTTYIGIATGVFVDAFTGNPVVELRIDASTSTGFTRRFFASELVAA